MKFLVTGGAGFIGSNLVDSLVANDNEVLILDDLSTGTEKFLEQHEREDKGSGDPHKSSILEVIETADYTVTNDGTLEELYTQIDEVIKHIDGRQN